MNELAIKVSGLSKKYGDVAALKDINLGIQAGSITALLGANGAGKTTLIEHLLGRQRAKAGTVTINGYEPDSYPARAAIGAIMQSTQIPSMLTVAEHIELFSSYYPAPLEIECTLHIANLTDLRNRRFDKLSGGQKQRVYFAIAICGNPEIILLDEPTVGLDTKSRRQLWECILTLKSEGKTVLLTTHYLEEAERLSDRLIYLRQGALAFDGTCQQFKQQLSNKKISCTTDLSYTELLALPSVLRVEANGASTTLYTENADITLRALFRKTELVQHISVTETSLEEVVLQLDEQLEQLQERVA